MVTSIANSLGFGSGIDTVTLVKDLAAASRLPKVQRLDSLAQANQAKVSALALPLADELHRNIEVARQNGLTDALAFAQRDDFLR